MALIARLPAPLWINGVLPRTLEFGHLVIQRDVNLPAQGCEERATLGGLDWRRTILKGLNRPVQRSVIRRISKPQCSRVLPRTSSARTTHFLVNHSHVRIARRDADRRHARRRPEACETHALPIL